MIKSVLFVGTAALALAACSGSDPEATATQDPAVIDSSHVAATWPLAGEIAPTGEAEAQSVDNSADTPPSPPMTPAQPMPASPANAEEPIDKTERGAREVLNTWARALETHQYGLAWEQFLNPPSSRADFVRWWQRYRTIRVSLGAGEGDAAMGTVYYTSVATLTGTTNDGQPFRLRGDVVARRVNDVDGATPAQLRWHIGTADLKDAGAR